MTAGGRSATPRTRISISAVSGALPDGPTARLTGGWPSSLQNLVKCGGLWCPPVAPPPGRCRGKVAGVPRYLRPIWTYWLPRLLDTCPLPPHPPRSNSRVLPCLEATPPGGQPARSPAPMCRRRLGAGWNRPCERALRALCASYRPWRGWNRSTYSTEARPGFRRSAATRRRGAAGRRN